MRKLIQAAATILVLGISFLVMGDAIAEKAKILPDHVGIWIVDKEVRDAVNHQSAVENQISYLTSIVASKALPSSDIDNLKKASAIRLLGVIKSTNSIGVLISNITFIDLKAQDKPALEALSNIGEPAVPYLLNILKDHPATPQECESAVATLMLIKNANPHIENWLAFVKEQKEKLPKEAWNRLTIYGNITD